MKTKLTLSIEKDVIEEAKVLAKENGTTLSALLEQYLKQYILDHQYKNAFREDTVEYQKLSPEVKERLKNLKNLVGILKTDDPDTRPDEVRLKESLLKKYGSRLGGMSGQRVLRNMGKDTFIVTPDVVRVLQNNGLDIKDTPSSARELRLIQGAFNTWHEQSGLPYSHMSRIAALSL